MEDIRVIVMPYELGRLRDGVGRGPERLLGLVPPVAMALLRLVAQHADGQIVTPADRSIPG